MLSTAGVQVGQGMWSWGLHQECLLRGWGFYAFQVSSRSPLWVTEAGSVCHGDTGHVREDVGWGCRVGVTSHLGGVACA